MLDFAINHSSLQDIHQKFITRNLDHCKYWISDCCVNYKLDIVDSSWAYVQMVSLDPNNNIIGYMSATISNDQTSVGSLSIISYNLIPNNIFYRDVITFIKNLFDRGYRKIKFSSVVGSPANAINTKLIQLYNGRQVGIYLNDKKLIDGKYYDYEAYEIFNPNTQNI